MHLTHFKKYTSFRFQPINEYPYLYTFTFSPNKFINYYDSFKSFIQLFDNRNIDMYVKCATCKNIKRGTRHKLSDQMHFHGFFCSKVEINISEFNVRPHDLLLKEIVFDSKHYHNFIDYINNKHKIDRIFSGYSL